MLTSGDYLINLCSYYFVSSKDVRLPREMQRAMAAEAEATREASAKVCPFEACSFMAA